MTVGVGRGRLSKMDSLPCEAAPLLEKLRVAIIERRVSQEVLREIFNADLATFQVEPISRGTFNRHVMKVYNLHQKQAGTVRVTHRRIL